METIFNEIRLLFPVFEHVKLKPYVLDFKEVIYLHEVGISEYLQACGDWEKGEVRITNGMRKALMPFPDRQALLLGHELGHILYRHTKNLFTSDEESVEMERQADCFGGKIVQRLGYSPQEAIKLFTETLGITEANTHPSYPPLSTRIADVLSGEYLE